VQFLFTTDATTQEKPQVWPLFWYMEVL